MSNKYEGTSTTPVPFVDVKVDFNRSSKSTTTIGTDYLGPWICFLFDFTYNDEDHCILDHYSFPQDEKDLSKDEVLALLMDYFVQKFKKLNIQRYDRSHSSSTLTANLSDVKLLIVGGD